MAKAVDSRKGGLIEATEVFLTGQTARKAKPSGGDAWWLDIPVPPPEVRIPTRQISARLTSADIETLNALVTASGQNLTTYLRWLVRVAAAGHIVPRRPESEEAGT